MKQDWTVNGINCSNRRIQREVLRSDMPKTWVQRRDAAESKTCGSVGTTPPESELLSYHWPYIVYHFDGSQVTSQKAAKNLSSSFLS